MTELMSASSAYFRIFILPCDDLRRLLGLWFGVFNDFFSDLVVLEHPSPSPLPTLCSMHAEFASNNATRKAGGSGSRTSGELRYSDGENRSRFSEIIFSWGVRIPSIQGP